MTDFLLIENVRTGLKIAAALLFAVAVFGLFYKVVEAK